MTIVQDPILQINGEKTAYVSGTQDHTKGIAERSVNVDSEGDIHITEDRKTAKGSASFELYSSPENEILFKKWIANGDNNIVTIIRGSLNSNLSKQTITNPNVKIKYGPEETFLVEFAGKPIVE